MNKYAKILFIIAVIGALACLASFIALIIKGSFTSGIIFGLAGLFCLSTAVEVYKYISTNNKNDK